MCEENSGDEASATGPLRAQSPPGTNGGCRHRGLPRAAHVALVPTRNDIAVTDVRTPNYNTEHTLGERRITTGVPYTWPATPT